MSEQGTPRRARGSEEAQARGAEAEAPRRAREAEVSAARVWLDDEPLRPTWHAPRRTRPLWIVVATVVVLAVVAGVLWATGGLAERSDDIITVQPGEVFETGPYQFVFTEATIWERRYGDSPRSGWEVQVYGFGRTTANTSGQLRSVWTAIGVDGSGIAENGSIAKVGQFRSFGVEFQPGMPMAPVVLQADLPAEFEPDEFIDLLVGRIVTENRSNTGDASGEVLTLTRQRYQMRLPMTIGTGNPPR